MTTSYSHVIRRAKRRALAEALSTRAVEAATVALRSLSAGTTPPAEARVIANRYCKVMGIEPATDAVLDYLCSADAADAPIEEIDGLMMFGDDEPDYAAATAAAHAAVGRARGR